MFWVSPLIFSFSFRPDLKSLNGDQRDGKRGCIKKQQEAASGTTAALGHSAVDRGVGEFGVWGGPSQPGQFPRLCQDVPAALAHGLSPPPTHLWHP